MAKQGKQPIHFEKAFAQLTTLIEQMEQGQLTLEQSLQHFEQGVGLVRHCQQLLSDAEQKVKVLTEQQGECELNAYTIEAVDVE